MTIAWVVGSGGLLGSALSRALQIDGTSVFLPTQAFCWRDADKLHSQLAIGVQSFGRRVQDHDRWEIYWAAGVGTMGSSISDLEPETNAFTLLLRMIEAQPQLNAKPGALSLASSAGAIYAGCTDAIIDNTSDPAPTTPYAYEKLKQEDLLRTYALKSKTTSALMARISTLYGPGGAIGKQQGLITHIARCILRNKPIQIYVPFDTIRDYITATDAATMIVATLRATRQVPGIYTRIIASEQPTTIAEIISVYKRITRRNPRIVTSASKLSSMYSRRIQFRTKMVSERAKFPKTSLVVGIAQVMVAERIKMSKGGV